MLSKKPFAVLATLLLLTVPGAIAQNEGEKSEEEISSTLDQWELKLLNMEKSLRTSSDHSVKSKHLLARIYFYFGYDQKTESLLRELIRTDELNHKEKKMLALIYYREGKLSESLELFEELYRDNNNDWLVKYYIDNIRKTLNIFGKASEQLKMEAEQLKGETEQLGRKTLEDKLNELNEYIFTSLDSSIGAEESDSSINSLAGSLLTDDTLLAPETKRVILGQTSDDYGDVSACMILKRESYEVLEDNKCVYTDHRMIKIFTDGGKNRYSDIEIGYNDSYESVEIEYLRVYTPDGIVYHIPQEKYVRLVTPWTGAYSHFKEKIITFPQITLNSTVEYEYKIITRHPLHPDDLSFSFELADEIPMLSQTYFVSHPITKKLMLRYPDDHPPVVEQDDSTKVYRWEIDSVAPIETEPYSQLTSYLPVIKGSFFQEWQDIYDWLKPFYLGDNIGLYSDLQNLVSELTATCSSEEEKVQAVYNWINQNIRYIAIEYGEGGVYPRNVNETYYNRYGDCKDQSTLLTAMLRYAGISACPVLIKTGSDFDSSIAGLSFNHCISYVTMDNKSAYVDVVAKNTPYNSLAAVDQDKRCFVIGDNGFEIQKTPLARPDENVEKRWISISLDNMGNIEVSKKTENWGVQNTLYKIYFNNMTPTETEEAIQYDISYFCPSGKLEDYKAFHLNEIDSPFVLVENFAVPDWLQKISSGIYAFKIPTVYFSFDETTQPKRKYPIIYESTASKKYEIELNYPRNFRIEKLPDNFKYNSDKVEFEYTFQQLENKLLLNVSYIRKVNQVEVEDYAEYKKTHDDILNKIEQQIIFVEDK
jgi:hypothetical protein